MWLFTTSKGTKIGLSNQEKWGVKMHRNAESPSCRFYDIHCISCSIWFMTPYSPVMVLKPSNDILEVGIWMGNPKYTYLQLPWIKSPLAFLLAPMCARPWRTRVNLLAHRIKMIKAMWIWPRPPWPGRRPAGRDMQYFGHCSGLFVISGCRSIL